ncbi:MAG: lipid-A-disaccharide synthase [Leptolyngbyaceae cyanobacterium]
MGALQYPVDILILSNGPGEITTWVKPVVQALRQQLGNDRSQVRISVILSPCPNASGHEADLARSYPQVDRVQAANHFFRFLVLGQTVEGWDWRPKGVVLFLGGDQFFAVLIGKRLGYRIVTYAEWEARWHRWVDRFGAMNAKIVEQSDPRYAHKFTVVGDLMAEASAWDQGQEKQNAIPKKKAPLIGILPGSKAAKLRLGLPFGLAIADCIQAQRPAVEFAIAVAPTLDIASLAGFADPLQNSMIEHLGWARGELIQPIDSLPYLKTGAGVKVQLWTEFPAYEQLVQCDLCITTIGANTAELGALAVPMIVILPTQQLDVMRAWDGIPGILVNLPGVGTPLAQLINGLALRRLGLLAWPNIWAKREIVPEMVGPITPEEVANRVLQYLDQPELLTAMGDSLRQIRGQAGAAQKLAQIVVEEIRQQMPEICGVGI